MNYWTSIGSILILFVPLSAHAYEQDTHELLSASALRLSTLSDPQRFLRLGFIRPIVDKTDQFLDSKTVLRPIADLVTKGANYEDDGIASINHFFNPVTGGSFYLDPADLLSAFPPHAAVAGIVSVLDSVAKTSPDWILAASTTVNPFSYPSLKSYFLQSLIDTNPAHRQAATGLMFETVGHMIHHMQDMAQPQHVRSDNHTSIDWLDDNCVPPKIDQTTLELCQSYLIVKNPSLYEAWTRDLVKIYRQTLPTTGYSPVYGPGTDGLTTFADPRHFWTDGGLGIADFTNANFLSAGTMDVSPPAIGQPIVVRVADLCSGAVPPCEIPYTANDVVTFYQSVVADRFRPAAGGLNSRAAAESIFAADFKQYNPTRRLAYTLNRFTFASAHAYLLPRAVAYSAGLINYVFRGDMAIAPPAEGVYAIVDHTPDDATTAGCGTPCGFRKIKLKLKNTTPNDDMTNAGGNKAKLFAVAKYHRNTCYAADLSGEYGGSAYTGPNCRSPDESIAVSDVKYVSSVERTFPDEALEFTFSPTAPIPINATDLYLQIVYAGQLGQETDAVAVTTLDLSEPTFLVFGNHNDFQATYNDDGSFASTIPFGTATRYALDLQLRFNPAQASPIASSQLDPGQYHRLAILTDQRALDYALLEQYPGRSADTLQMTVTASDNQKDYQGTASIPPYVQLRRTTPSSWAYGSDLRGGAIYWEPGTLCLNGSTTCAPIDRTVDQVARRYPPFVQATPKPMTINF